MLIYMLKTTCKTFFLQMKWQLLHHWVDAQGCVQVGKTQQITILLCYLEFQKQVSKLPQPLLVLV